MRKILKTLIMTGLLLMLCATPAFAGNTDFSAYNVTNPNGTYTFRGLSGTKNTKATAQANWFMRVDDISFTMSTTGTLGMAFTPMKKNITGTYSTVGADTAWTKTSYSGYRYYGWGGNGTANKSYYLGVRLDTLLTSGSAQANGIWNSN